MPSMKLSLPQKLLALCIVGASLAVAGELSNKSHSFSLASVSVTLSNSRLSFRGALGAGNTVGTSQVIINTTAGAYPSTNSAQLVEGDTIAVGEGGSLATHDVTDIVSGSQFTIDDVLASGDADTGDDVISTQSASLTVRLTTSNAIEGGRFRVLVPALDSDAASSDGIPDGGYFEFGTSAPTVTCPSDIANYDFVTGTATASAITISGADYHSYECAYSGTGGVSTAFDGTTNDAIVINPVINPAPKATHIQGIADTYRVIVQQLNNNFDIADQTTVAIGVIEAVRVTASVAPQITFRILGVNAGTTLCNGNSMNVTTTPTSVPFGELLISGFTYAAQGLTVSTNAVGGYSVTAVENDQLGRNGGTCLGDNTGSTCIPDSAGDNSTMSHTSGDEWSSSTVKGFGYTLDNSNATGLTPAFEYDSSTGSCDGTGDCFRQFADAEDSQAPQTVFSHNDVADNHNLYVCYKAVISATQAAGNYENYITYTATATF